MKPPVGNQPSHTAKTSISSCASQKIGSDQATTEPTESTPSIAECGR